MHMNDALLSPAVAGAMWLATGTTIALGSRALKRSLDHRRVPLMGVMGALVFATQMVNFTIPGTGSSGHFAGGMLLAILLGPHASFLTMASVLTIQALFFADGGLLALGANIFNLGFFSSYVIYPLVYLPLARLGQGALGRRGAIWVGSVLALQVGALGVVLETTTSGVAELPLLTFLLAMQPIHLAIGVVEGLITVSVVEFIVRLDPVILRPAEGAGGRGPAVRVLGALGVLVVLTGGVLSWFASTRPDGLEWSTERVLGEGRALVAPDTEAHRLSAAIQERVAVLPDYSFPGAGAARKDAGAGETPPLVHPDGATTLSGLVGGALTLVLAGALGWLLRRRRTDGATSP